MPATSFNIGGVEGQIANLNDHIDSYDVLWTGDAHTVNDEMSLSHPITDYKAILFIFNVIPSRSPQFDIPASSLWYPSINTHYQWNVSCYSASVRDVTLNVYNASKLKIDNYTKEASQTYTPGIVEIIGFKTY